MRCLLTGYAVSFNRRHKRSGHLSQNRYQSIPYEEPFAVYKEQGRTFRSTRKDLYIVKDIKPAKGLMLLANGIGDEKEAASNPTSTEKACITTKNGQWKPTPNNQSAQS